MRFFLLGPLEVTDDGGKPVDVGGRQPRVVLAALLAARRRPVAPDALIEVIWGDHPPRSATGTLQTYVSRLRRMLDDHGGPTLQHDAAGYRLDTTGHVVDIERFEQLAAEGEAHWLAGRSADAGSALAAALALWRGDALVELVEQGSAIAQAVALEEQRLALHELRIEVDLAVGRHAQVVGELQALADRHPLRESLQAKLALALYRSGRQADGLRVLSAVAERLRDELGLEPSRMLAELEARILVHDPSLDIAVTSPKPADASTVPVTTAATAATVETVSPRDGATRVPLVGRSEELAELLSAFEEASEDARFVVLEGDPGIGKSRLAEELGASADRRGSLVAWGRSNELGAAPALWPWLPVLRAVVAAVGDEVPELLAEVLAGESPLVAGQGAAVQFERFDAIADLLERVGKEQTIVVLLDDLQWCDHASLELLQFLCARLLRGVLVVVTVRTPAIGQSDGVTDTLAAIARRHGSRRLRLRGLGAAATGALLDAVGSTPPTPEIAARIHERAEGNPFYAIELARLLRHGDASEVPASVRDAIRRRLDQLPVETLDLATIAAVVGRDIDLPLVSRVAGVDIATCIDRLDPAAAHRLLEESPIGPGGLRFSHALVREVLLDDLTPLRRSRLHLAVADAMAAAAGGDDAVGRDEVELLAGHLWYATAMGVGDRAAAAVERAAETAISRVAYVQAEELLGRAHQLRRGAGSTVEAKQAELRTVLRLLEVAQTIRYFAGTDRLVLQRAQELAAELGIEDVARKMAWSEWAALSTSGRLAECRPMAERYLARWGVDPRPQVRATAHVLFGVDEWTRARIASAIDHLDRALVLLADAPPPTDAFEGEYRVVAHAFALYSHAARGDVTVEEALAGFHVLLEGVPPEAVPAVCAFAAATAAVHLRWDDVARLVDRALDADRAAQFAFFGGQLLMQRGCVTAVRGHLDDGIALFLEGRSRYRAVGGQSTIDTYQALLAEVLARAGRVAEASELLAGARRHFDEVGEGPDEMPLLIAEGVVAALAGDPGVASERLATAVRLGRAKGSDAFADRARRVAEELSVPLVR